MRSRKQKGKKMRAMIRGIVDHVLVYTTLYDL